MIAHTYYVHRVTHTWDVLETFQLFVFVVYLDRTTQHSQTHNFRIAFYKITGSLVILSEVSSSKLSQPHNVQC